MKKDIIYNLVKKYSIEYKEKTNPEVKEQIKIIQNKLIQEYKQLNGKRKIEKYVIL